MQSALDHQLAGLALVAEGANAGRERISFLAEIGLNYVELGEPEKAVEHLERAERLLSASPWPSAAKLAELARSR